MTVRYINRFDPYWRPESRKRAVLVSTLLAHVIGESELDQMNSLNAPVVLSLQDASSPLKWLYLPCRIAIVHWAGCMSHRPQSSVHREIVQSSEWIVGM